MKSPFGVGNDPDRLTSPRCAPLIPAKPMRRLILCLCVLTALPTVEAVRPNRASVEELLTLMHSRRMVDTMLQQIDGAMAGEIQQGLRVQSASPNVRHKAAQLRQAMDARLQAELSWGRTKDIFVRAFSDGFSQTEVNELINFYESPAGQALVTKMPAIMRETRALMQARMRPVIQDLQAGLQKAIAKVRATEAGNSGAGSKQAPDDSPGGSSSP